MTFPATVPGTSPLGYMGTKVARPIALINEVRDPQPSDARNYDLGTIWINRLSNNAFILTSKPGNVAFWLPFVGGSLGVISLTSDTGPTFPVAGNINVFGSSGITSTTVGNTITLDNLRDLSPYVVNVAGGSEYTSIQAAINQAVLDGHDETNPAVVFIYCGTYVEDITLASGVYLEGLEDGRGFLATVTIQGSMLATANGPNQFIIKNLTIANPNGNTLVLDGTVPMRFFANNCDINFGLGGATAISFICNSGTFGFAVFQNCNISGDDYAIRLFNHNAVGLLFCDVNAANINAVEVLDTSRLTSRLSNISFSPGGIAISLVGSGECKLDYSTVLGQISLADTTNGDLTYTAVDSGLTECLAIAPAAVCRAIANIMNSNAASGFWCTGTGTIATGGNNTLTGSAGLIDPGLTITGFGAG